MAAMKQAGAFVGGLLVGSPPHLATAVAGRTHLTPLAGRESSAAVNLVWGLGNVVAGLALTRAFTRSAGSRWDGPSSRSKPGSRRSRSGWRAPRPPCA
jgi:hypothetical protein